MIFLEAIDFVDMDRHVEQPCIGESLLVYIVVLAAIDDPYYRSVLMDKVGYINLYLIPVLCSCVILELTLSI